jgi:hypothetical protein
MRLKKVEQQEEVRNGIRAPPTIILRLGTPIVLRKPAETSCAEGVGDRKLVQRDA